MKLFDDAYISYLNLDHRVDRREHMEREMAAVGLRAERTRGGRMYEGDPNFAPTTIRNGTTPGTEGCYMGQLAIMEEAWNRGQHAFVMEDDVVFCSDFWDRMKLVQAFLSSHPWDVFWFGATFHVNPPVWHKDDLGRDVELTKTDRIVRTYGCWSTYAYLVNRTSIKKITTAHRTLLPTSIGIDTTFIEMQPELYTYAFVPGCVKQFDSWSDIGNDMTVFSNFEKLGPYWWQDRMEHFDPDAYEWAEARV